MRAAPSSFRSHPPPTLRPSSFPTVSNVDWGHNGFDQLDELLKQSMSAGLVTVSIDSASMSQMTQHIRRRSISIDRPCYISDSQTSDVWRDLLALLDEFTVDPVSVAQRTMATISEGVLVVACRNFSKWGQQVFACLRQLVQEQTEKRPQPLVIVLAEASLWNLVEHGECTPLSIDSELTKSSFLRWWEALSVEIVSNENLPTLGQLNAWAWTASQQRQVDTKKMASLSQEQERALALLKMSDRVWRLPDVLRLGITEPVLRELEQLQWVKIEANRISIAELAGDVVIGNLSAEDQTRLAELLPTEPEPWSWMRAAEIFASLGHSDRAMSEAARAISAVLHRDLRSDLWLRIESLLKVKSIHQAELYVHFAELALRLGDLEQALTLARGAAEIDGSVLSLVTLGKTTLSRGDLKGARVVLERALAQCGHREESIPILVELGELRYASGELEVARSLAEKVLTETSNAQHRLRARNVLGKLLLAGAKWEEAEIHFAEDACEAACAKDRVGELRARVNRSIAVLSSGRRDEARAMLEQILIEAEMAGELQATAFALSNLATIAIFKHDYAQALQLSERTVEVRLKLGDRLHLARAIANLAELRLLLGLNNEAEQALIFARNTCGPDVPGMFTTSFSLVSARILLAKGRTSQAAREIQNAIVSTAGSSDGALLSKCYWVLAHIALEDGDLARAQDGWRRAQASAKLPLANAEVALLEAAIARAQGHAFGSLAQKALELCKAADDLQLICAAHMLVCESFIPSDIARAKQHLSMAVALRDEMMEALPEWIQHRFIEKKEIVALSRMIQRLDNGTFEPLVVPSDRSSSTTKTVNSLHRQLVGQHPSIGKLRFAIQKVASTDATILIHGESGTGKELVAEAIHQASARKDKPLIKVNCAALVETLLLSELFGHEKGAFTGAAVRRRGRFEMAEGGTLFLDEIGDISPKTQVSLLRVLQEKTFERVGGNTPIRADVRIVCATHRDLRKMVEKGEFREDLYYRLRGFVLEVPALRDRMEDLPFIAESLLERIAVDRNESVKQLSKMALSALSNYTWPGNVRELENALRTAVLFSETHVIELTDFTDNIDSLRELGGVSRSFGAGTDSALENRYEKNMVLASLTNSQTPVDAAYAHIRAGSVSLSDLKRDIERDCIARALLETSGNITKAATLLGMKRPRLSQLVKQYGLGDGSEDSL